MINNNLTRKKMKTILILFLSTFFSINGYTESLSSGENTAAPELNDPEISYTLKIDENSYARFVRQLTERGISPADFGRWIEGNMAGSVSIGRDGGYASHGNAQLIIMKIDRNGRILAEQSINIQVAEREAPLRAAGLASHIDRMFPGGNVLFPGGNVLFPGGNVLFQGSAVDDAKRSFARNAAQQLQGVRQVPHVRPNIMEQDNISGIGIMLWPDTTRMEDSDKVTVKPSGVLFVQVPDFI